MSIIAKRFEIQEQIGLGGMGAVYRGHDRATGEIVAIKQLLPQYVENNRDAVERFIREGEALRQLNHPNIVKMVAAVEEASHYYLIMEYMQGGSLADLLSKQRQLPLSRVLQIALDLADALTRAHRLDIIHRDIKPANVLIADDGTPRLTDFGMARMGNSHITGSGDVLGTIAYACPEGFNGEAIDTRSDIWSFGVMLFEMLAGQQPFTGEVLQQLIQQILFVPTPDLETLRPDVPTALIDLIYRMLSKSPAERIPSVRLVGAEIEALLRGAASSPLVLMQVETEGVPLQFITPTPGTAIYRHNLPIQTSAFVGREDELAQLSQLISDPRVRMITILGPGGMGKTRLSLETGQAQLPNFPGGVFFIELAPLDSADGIPAAVATAVDYPFQPDQRSPQQQLLDYFREKQQLLIFDNFEHVLDGADFVSAILKSAPGVKILASSRERLNLSEETLFLLSGMDFPAWESPKDALEYAAVKLFLQSARRVQPSFTLSADNLNALARICRLVSGMPLGIVLAAAWLEMLSLDEIASEIERSLDFLETEQRDIPGRQRSLRAVFEYSWALLTESEQQILMKLSVFRGGMTREAAQAVGEATLKQLQSFVNKSLLSRNTETGRFETHELMRQYAAEHLSASDGFIATKNSHATYYAAFVQQQEADLKGKNQRAALNRMEADFENIKAAWEWTVQQGDAETIRQMSECVCLFCIFRSRFADGEVLFEQARQRWVGTTEPVTARLLLRFLPSGEDALPFAEQALQIGQDNNLRLETAVAKQTIGRHLSHRRLDVPKGILFLEESISDLEQLQEHFYQAQALDDLAWSYFIAAQLDKRLQVAQESVALRRRIGDQIGVANALRNLGSTMVMLSRYDDAATYLREAGDIAREMKDLTNIAWTNGMLGYRLMTQNKLDEADALVREGLRIATEINLTVVRTQTSFLHAIILCLQGEVDRARQIAFEEFTEKDENFDIALRGPCTGARSVVANALGDYEYLEYFFNRVMSHSGKSRGFIPIFGWFTMTAVYLSGLLEHWGYHETVVETLAFAFNHPQRDTYWLEQWPLIQQRMANLRQRLGSAACTAAWDRGKTKSADEIYALLAAIHQEREGSQATNS